MVTNMKQMYLLLQMYLLDIIQLVYDWQVVKI